MASKVVVFLVLLPVLAHAIGVELVPVVRSSSETKTLSISSRREEGTKSVARFGNAVIDLKPETVLNLKAVTQATVNLLGKPLRSWTFAPTGKYDTWVANAIKAKTLKVGDTLVFTFSAAHNLYEITAAQYASCDLSKATKKLSDTGKYNLKIVKGTKHYACRVAAPGSNKFDAHCTAGMKLKISI